MHRLRCPQGSVQGQTSPRHCPLRCTENLQQASADLADSLEGPTFVS